jgi:hypothetical protein
VQEVLPGQSLNFTVEDVQLSNKNGNKTQQTVPFHAVFSIVQPAPGPGKQVGKRPAT